MQITLLGTSYVTLSEALSWIAFGDLTNSDVHWQKYTEAKRRMEEAVVKFSDLASRGKIDVLGKWVSNHDDDPAEVDTTKIPAERFHDYQQYDQQYCGLRVGTGLAWFANEHEGTFVYTVPLTQRKDFYRDVLVLREQLESAVPISKIKVQATIAAETQCGSWLTEQFSCDTGHQRTKGDFQSAAQKVFGDALITRGFGRAWDKVAPSCGRSGPGAKRKP